MTLAVTLLFAAYLALTTWERRQWSIERARLVNAVVAKHAGEVAVLNAEPRAERRQAEQPDPNIVTVGAAV